MTPTARYLADPWLRACAAVGALGLAVEAIAGLPWPLWFGWAYVVLLSAWEVARHREG
ncbi:hypothetical protein ABFT23_16510 [Nocardioides sp. C4-1]|uniref:hypothetical protein n=1 Tax=Nocardioides sp. C4-1 TaxID=3151851 RepID=UPI0032662AAB